MFQLVVFRLTVFIANMRTCEILLGLFMPSQVNLGSYCMNIYVCSALPLCSRISKSIPTTKDVEPLLEIDGDIRSFEVFLSSRTPVLTVRDVEMFLPCTVNLDPKLREIIAGQPRQTASPHHLPHSLTTTSRGNNVGFEEHTPDVYLLL